MPGGGMSGGGLTVRGGSDREGGPTRPIEMESLKKDIFHNRICVFHEFFLVFLGSPWFFLPFLNCFYIFLSIYRFP